MAPDPRSSRGHLARGAVPVVLALLAAACADTTGPDRVAVPSIDAVPPPSGTLAVLECRADRAAATVECAPADAPALPGGVRAEQRTVGGQGLYVRLTSTNLAWDAGTGAVSFDATVQNLSTLALATADGASRDSTGLRVFFASGPAATGGAGLVSVSNPDGTGTFTDIAQPYIQYGGTLSGVDGTELGADGVLATAETSAPRTWQLSAEAGVTAFAFTVYVATQTPAGAIATAAPQVTSISPATLVPGQPATLTGINFNPTPASNTVQIGGVPATVTAASPTQLTVTVPCRTSGTLPVNVTQGGMRGLDLNHPLQVAQRTVGVGQALVLTSAAESHCNELPAVGGPARYIVSVFSANASPTSNSPFSLTADGVDGGAVAARTQVSLPGGVVGGRQARSLQESMELAAQQVADARHHELLEMNRAAFARGQAEFPRGRAARGAQVNRDVVNGDAPPTRQFRVSNIAPPAGQTFCSSFYVVNATRVYFDGKIAIYEDDATPAAFKAANSATMASNYQRIGDQFNADMEPIVRDNFGDVLLRDAETDNNGVLIALFSPRINAFGGVAGFVVSCDQFPNNDTTTTPYAPGGPYTGQTSTGATASFGASNFGEFFYAYQPVTDAAGYVGNTPENWYRTIRSTFIHETKHVASHAARVANNAPYESSWLEEGTARHAEELWMRNAVDNQAWKSNIPFGSFANPINIYCDLRPTAAECIANPRRPSQNMLRHFNPMYTHMFGQNARLLSPFGATASDNASYWYAISWSLVRYAIDRYGASDAAFLTALTSSTTTGVTNLAGRAGVSIDQLLGGWNLALAADDHPLLAVAPSPDIQMPTWNMRSIYAGLNTDPNASGFTLAYPLVPTQLGFGTFSPTAITTLRGGGALWYEISGTQTAAQLLRLQGSGGGALPSDVRLAVTRIQ